MKTVNDFNGHTIQVPDIEGLEVHTGQQGAGAYDYLTYRNWEICTYDREQEEAVYGGTFMCHNGGHAEFDAADLQQAVEGIDERIGRARYVYLSVKVSLDGPTVDVERLCQTVLDTLREKDTVEELVGAGESQVMDITVTA